MSVDHQGLRNAVLYSPVGDARYESRLIKHVSLMPIPSLWGHLAGAGGNTADSAFLNDQIRRLLDD